MLTLFKRFIRLCAMSRGKCVWLYKRVCRPDGLEYSAFLKRHGKFYSIGEHCSILASAIIADPEYAMLRQELRGRLAHWLKRAEDPFVLPADE